MQRAGWAIAGALALTAVIGFVALRPAGAPGIFPGASSSAAGTPGAAGEVARALREPYTGPAFVTGLENLPASLEGTEVDGALRVDADGNLVMDIQVRNLFDYFLSVQGEESLATIIARIRAYIRHQLPAAAAAQAEAALAAYLNYREAASALATDTPVTGDGKLDIAALRAQKEQGRALRERYLDPAQAAAFYADEDAYDDYSLARLQVMQDPALTPTEKAARTTALLDALPPALQEDVRATSLYVNLQELTQDWQQRGGPASELRSIREAAVGPAAADRLENLDRDRAAWQQRVDAYLAARDSILRNAGLADSDKERQIAQLRETGFDAAERLRLPAFELQHDAAR